MQRFDSAMQGSYRGQEVPAKVAITILWERQDGEWRQRFYQQTPLRG